MKNELSEVNLQTSPKEIIENLVKNNSMSNGLQGYVQKSILNLKKEGHTETGTLAEFKFLN